MSERVTLRIDGKEVETRSGVPIIDAAEEHGVYIPRFCYHPRMRAVGMCRMCLVEVKGPRGFSLQPACYIAVADGMEVITESEAVKKAQNGVIEFLLANHPLDCPVCDRGGECPLQDQTFAHGSGETRFIEEKRHFAKPISISPLIKLDRERCIQCDRCTRFADEIAGEPLIDFADRGNGLRVANFPGVDFNSYFSGNIVQICPVGALTGTPYRFKARPWDLTQSASTCGSCGLGCQVAVQSSGTEIVRLLGLDSEAVNQGWLCDRGRFGFSALNNRTQRVTEPSVRREEGTFGVSWIEAYAVATERLREKDKFAVGVIGGEALTNESAYAWAKLVRGYFSSDRVAASVYGGFDPRVVSHFNPASLAEIRDAKEVVVVDCDPREELPVLYLQLRAAALAGHTIREITSAPTSLSPIAKFSETLDPADPARAIDAALAGLDTGSAVIVAGRMNRAISDRFASVLLREVAARCGESTKVLLATQGFNGAGSGLAGLEMALYPGGTSEVAAVAGTPWRIGAHKEALEILDAAEDGEIHTLFLLDVSFEQLGVSLERARQIADHCRIVSCARFESGTTREIAHVVLPLAAWGEEHGSVLNVERRLLRVAAQVEPMGSAKSAWVIATEIAAGLGFDLGFYVEGDVSGELRGWGGLYRDLPSQAEALDGPLLPVTRGSVVQSRMLDPMATPGIGSVERQGVNVALGKATDPSAPMAAAGQTPPFGELSSPTGALLDPLEGGELRPNACWLVVRTRLFDSSPEIEANPFFNHLVSSPSLSLHPETAERLGLGEASEVSIPTGNLALKLDKEVPQNTAILESDLSLLGVLARDVVWPQLTLGVANG